MMNESLQIATHNDLDGVACAAIILRIFPNALIDFFNDEEILSSNKSYDIVFDLPKPSYAKKLIDHEDRSNGGKLFKITENDIVISNDNICQMVIDFFRINDEICNQISKKGNYIEDELIVEKRNIDFVIRYISGSHDKLFNFAAKWSSLGDTFFQTEEYSELLEEIEKKKKYYMLGIQGQLNDKLNSNTDVVVIDTREYLPYAFAKLGFDLAFDMGIPVVCLLYENNAELNHNRVEMSIKVNAKYMDEYDVSSFAISLGGGGTKDWSGASVENISQIFAGLSNYFPLSNISYLRLTKKSSSIKNTCLDKLFCIEFSANTLTSDLLARMMLNDIVSINRKLCALDEVDECVIIKKCNCVEYYISISSTNVIENIYCEIAAALCLDKDLIEKIVVTHFGIDAVKHLFRVSCSLESYILGDCQVYSQVRTAYNTAKKCGSVGILLEFVFEEAFRVVKRTFKETKIQQHGCSLGRLAVKMVSLKTDISGKTLSVVGNSQIGNIVITSLKETNKKAIINLITNSNCIRHDDVNVISYESFPSVCLCSDIIFFCSSSDKPIIDEGNSFLLKNCELAVDLGFPKNCDVRSDNIHKIIPLNEIVEFGKSVNEKREEEVKKIDCIIQSEISNIYSRLKLFVIEKIAAKMANDIIILPSDKAKLAYTIVYIKSLLERFNIDALTQMLQ